MSLGRWKDAPAYGAAVQVPYSASSEALNFNSSNDECAIPVMSVQIKALGMSDSCTR